MAKANTCANITDPKKRKACLAKAKKAGANGSATSPDWGGLVKFGVKKMTESRLK